MRRALHRIAFPLLVSIFLAASLPAQQVYLTIFHTNDTHGHLLPFSYPTDVPRGSDLAQLKERTNIGGIARRATIVKNARVELEREGKHVWLVDVGDFSDGTAFSTEYHGEADAAAMNAAGYTFGALGNHEFNQPLAQLKNLLKIFQYPILCANAIETSGNRPLTQASLVKEVGPLKIGVFGLVTREASDYPAARDGVRIEDEIESARRTVKELRKESDIIIALSHCGDTFDKKLAAAVPDIDVIVGGHSHSRIPIPDFVLRTKELKSQDINSTIIVQAHQWGGELGRLDLLFVKDGTGAWHIDRYIENLTPVTHQIPDDETVAAVIDKYWKPIAGKYGEHIGSAAGDFVERGDDLANYNLVADAVRETFGAEIGLENMGGVRAPLVKGQITKADLIDMDPFDNTVVRCTISGRNLKKILLTHRPAVSGMQYRIENGAVTKLTIGGKPVQDTRLYVATTNSYFARIALKGIPFKNTGKLRLDVVINYVRKKGTVSPVFDGRRVIIS